ncbi:MAG: hypothetical protein IH624_02525 [Phycisphaerae bacterium]|nr:hypothetical protein [Phycisphaerae bacterium]
MNILDWLENLNNEHNLILVGLLALAAAFGASFLLKTAWGLWDNRNAKVKYDRHGHRVKAKQAVCKRCLEVYPVNRMEGFEVTGYVCQKCTQAARKAQTG